MAAMDLSTIPMEKFDKQNRPPVGKYIYILQNDGGIVEGRINSDGDISVGQKVTSYDEYVDLPQNGLNKVLAVLYYPYEQTEEYKNQVCNKLIAYVNQQGPYGVKLLDGLKFKITLPGKGGRRKSKRRKSKRRKSLRKTKK
jgi:hypothetical protein